MSALLLLVARETTPQVSVCSVCLSFIVTLFLALRYATHCTASVIELEHENGPESNICSPHG